MSVNVSLVRCFSSKYLNFCYCKRLSNYGKALCTLCVILIQAGLDSRSLSFIPEVESMLTSAKALPKSKPVTGSEQTLCICDIGGECLIALNFTTASDRYSAGDQFRLITV